MPPGRGRAGLACGRTCPNPRTVPYADRRIARKSHRRDPDPVPLRGRAVARPTARGPTPPPTCSTSTTP